MFAQRDFDVCFYSALGKSVYCLSIFIIYIYYIILSKILVSFLKCQHFSDLKKNICNSLSLLSLQHRSGAGK